MNEIINFFADYTLRNVFLGTMLLGIGSGAVGSFAVLRKQSLLGDAVAHAALPGVVIAFLITGSKMTFPLLIGAGLTGLIGTFFINSIVNTSKIDTDAAQGIVLGVFLGLGFLLLTYVQKLPGAGKSGLDKFIFGQAATITGQDVILIFTVETVILLTVLLFWKELKISTFDPGFSQSIGFSPKIIESILTVLIIITIVIGIQSVGVILMSALLLAPAAAARQWTDRLSIMCFLSAIFGAASGMGGAVISSQVLKMPTGPMIVCVLTGFTLISILFSPHRGIIQAKLKKIHIKNKILKEIKEEKD
ncbi:MULTISPECIES: transition metal ABC transporter permease subunit TroC [unclassified Treponema]|uniref:transition metal ABC transporter permease subunit TroC n=1 Tax=unclassified Treponema TaxID=2638727 RepID=UPI0020A32A3B|nr:MULTISPECIES: transition metal ABC transporter permease subunit TroC [unclassified Treponema]UTC65865.1 transition metal ABC transporter permease subunit TroC [Treponema sp. OMZ 789]UTC68593.1 transition metal ABC transporter permease subunit TroC [Treponema sp. OMZ 790]UTC71323.1 transition metal ABC transporter permease subunit TroC [Treponema sp. OMZ 791]